MLAGGQEIYSYLKNPEPVEMSLEDFIAGKSDAEWVTLKEVRLSMFEAAASIVKSSRRRETIGDITAIYIPIRSKNDKPDAPVHLVLETRNADIIGTYSDLTRVGVTPQQREEALAHRAGSLIVTRDVTGLVRTGFRGQGEVMGLLSRSDMNMAEGFVIVSEDWKPSLFFGLLFLGLGTLGGLAQLQAARSKTGPAIAPRPLTRTLPPRRQ